jgi:glycosyltransferase involved in cell wall biosynthesis
MLTSVPFPPVCGIGSYISNLSRKLTHEGHEVIVVTRGGPKKQVIEYDTFLVYKLPFIMAYPFHADIHGLFVNQFLKTFKQDFDLVHVHVPLPPAVKTQLPIVTTFHSPHFADFYSTDIVDINHFLTKNLEIIDYHIEKSLISSSTVLSAVSQRVKLDLESYYPIKPGTVRVFGNAPSDRFLEAGRSLSSKKDEFMILFVGRLEYDKGVLDLVESMKLVTQRIPKARLVVVGKGPLLRKVIKRVSELNLQKHVEVNGPASHDKVLQYYLSASIFVLPSYHEGLATTGLEAMACRAAVVATDVRGNSEVVKCGHTGLLVPIKEPRALGDAIVYLLEHSDLRERLASNARELIEKNFTWEKVTDRVLESYLTAIK